MKDKWNERYKSDEYFFGKEPNLIFKDIIDSISPGKAMFVGEGEGRNSVYAASIGWEVNAIDISNEGKLKAEKLAKENKVAINYEVSDAFNYNFKDQYYDAVIMIYFHIETELRENFYQKIISSLKPNGHIILLVYDEDHLNNNNNGPHDINMLYTLENIAETFIDLDFKLFAKEEVVRVKKDVSQKSTVIKFVGKKVILQNIF